MVRLSFIHPIALWLLLLLPLLWAFSLVVRRAGALRLGPTRFWALLALRSLGLTALVLALAGAQLVRPVDDLTVVFLIDGSDSVAPAQRAQALEFVNAALAERRPNDRAAVVLFGRNALVERAPAPLESLQRLSSAVVASRTNIEEAIQLGLALFPADAQKRLVLLSDGRENEGRAVEAARLAALRGVPLDIVSLPAIDGPDVLVASLSAPDVAREGQDVTLAARIESSIDTSGQLQIFADNELIATEEVAIERGVTVLPLTVTGGEAGFRRYEVRLEAEGDAQPLNNRAAAFTDVQGPPRLLLIATDPAAAAPLRSALEAVSVRVEVLPPEAVPATPAALHQYAAIILVDVPAQAAPGPLQAALPVYVRDQGGSLAMIGGAASFGAGGWRHSPVADALPVDMDPRSREQRPDLALTLVIDRSGSMAEAVVGGTTRLQLAKEAVYQASLGLEETDQIGVVVFDTRAEWVLPMQPLPSIANIQEALSRFSDGGGTDIRSGIAAAAEALPTVDARTKHVILLTDGIADSNYADLIDEMRANQITISVVAIGPDTNPVLEQIAERGGGRYYKVLTIPDVPRIFLTETVTVAGRDIVEEEFTPLVALPAPVVRNLSGLPPLYGYNGVEARSAARTILVSPDGRPILAQWQYGLGRGVAWTSDLKGRWARDWVNWAEFPRFAGGLVDMLLPPQQVEGLAFEARADGPRAVLELTVQDGQGRFVEGATVQGRLLDPADTGAPITLTQVGVGRYRAVVPAESPGVYLAQVAVTDAQGQTLGTASAGLVVSYSPEYSPSGDTPSVLEDLAALTGGRERPAATAVFAPTGQAVGVVEEIGLPLLWLALLLWPLDIALRRLLMRQDDMAPLKRWLAERFRRPRSMPAAPAPTLERLHAARSRAQRRSDGRDRGRVAELLRGENGNRDEPPPKPPAPPSPVPADDALASLLAAKQRARRRRQGDDA